MPVRRLLVDRGKEIMGKKKGSAIPWEGVYLLGLGEEEL